MHILHREIHGRQQEGNFAKTGHDERPTKNKHRQDKMLIERALEIPPS